MFYCPLHNWYSDEAPCPACHQTITTTVANSTEQPERKEWEWTDELVLKFSTKWLNDRVAWAIMHDFAATPSPIQIELKEFKEQQSKQPLKPDTKEEKIEVGNLMADSYDRILIMDTSHPIPKEKYPLIKEAIESVLNNDEIKQVNFKDGYWVHPDMLSKMSEITGKIYTQKELDEAIQKAFNAAREREGLPINPTGPSPYLKYNNDKDYINSLNTNSKTSKHWT